MESGIGDVIVYISETEFRILMKSADKVIYEL